MPGFNYGGTQGDGTNWSSERGTSTDPGADNGHGHSGDHTGTVNTVVTSGGTTGSLIAHTPWGDVTEGADGYGMMNGIRMDSTNSQLVQISPTQVTQVLNSVLDRQFRPEPGQHNGAPTRSQMAGYAVDKAQAEVKTATDKVTTANNAVNQAQTRLNNANAAIPERQAAITTAQTAFDKAKAYATSISGFAHAQPISAQFREWQRAGYEAQKAQNALNDAKNALTNAQNEQVAAQHALDAANTGVTAATHDKQNADHAVADASDMQDAIGFVSGVFETISKKYSEKTSKLAQDLAAEAHGKTIKSVDQAIATFDKYKGTALSKLSASDKAAIVTAFESLEQSRIATDLAKWGKVFGVAGQLNDAVGLAQAIKTGVDTGDFHPAINKLESLAVSRVATQLAGIALEALFVSTVPLAIPAAAIIIALAATFFSTDDAMQNINNALGF